MKLLKLALIVTLVLAFTIPTVLADQKVTAKKSIGETIIMDEQTGDYALEVCNDIPFPNDGDTNWEDIKAIVFNPLGTAIWDEGHPNTKTVEGTIVNTHNSDKAESLSSDYVPSLSAKALLAVNGNDPIVYVTRTGQCYHRGSCSYLRKSKIPMRLSEARKLYRPCKRCNPPQ